MHTRAAVHLLRMLRRGRDIVRCTDRGVAQRTRILASKPGHDAVTVKAVLARQCRHCVAPAPVAKAYRARAVNGCWVLANCLESFLCASYHVIEHAITIALLEIVLLQANASTHRQQPEKEGVEKQQVGCCLLVLDVVDTTGAGEYS